MLARFRAMGDSVRRAAQDEHGVTVLEYALIASLIFLVCIAMVAVFGQAVLALFTKAHDAIPA